MITISVQGDGLERMLHITQKAAHLNRAALMRRLGSKVLDQHVKRITSEKTDPAGKPWAALMPSTVAQKGNSNILIRTGAMAGAYTLRSSALMAAVSNATKYLGYHQGGTRKMVQRRPMGLSRANIAELQSILNQEIAHILA